MNMTAQDMVNYVAASSQLIDSCRAKLRKQASELKALKALKAKDSSAKTISLDEGVLLKTASVVHTIYGRPATVTPEQIASYWKSNPNTMLDTMHKLASAKLESVANGEHIGSSRQEPVRKKASAEPVQSADEQFWKKYK